MKGDSKRKKLVLQLENNIYCTGGVVFVGDGFTGKTHTATNICAFKGKEFHQIELQSFKKSVNIEFDYFIAQSHVEEYSITLSCQLFIMPGQKGRAGEKEGLAFEDAFDLYFDVATVQDVMALILTYNLADPISFQNLEYWLEKAIERNIIKEYTNYILVGTHGDKRGLHSITDNDLTSAKRFISLKIQDKLGYDLTINKIHSIKVSNTTGEGIQELQNAIYDCFSSALNLPNI